MVFLTKIQTWPVIDAATFRMRTVIAKIAKIDHNLQQSFKYVHFYHNLNSGARWEAKYYLWESIKKFGGKSSCIQFKIVPKK
jgi:hypothetical protein